MVGTGLFPQNGSLNSVSLSWQGGKILELTLASAAVVPLPCNYSSKSVSNTSYVK